VIIWEPLVFDFVRLCAIEYHLRLARHGIPLRPADRTPDQQATAVVERWAVVNQALIQLGSLDPTALEAKDA
jgi:hypothetical protein